MLFSVKMRASQGESKVVKGKHISGAERLVAQEKLEETVLSMLRRAQNHEKGKADFINIKVSQVDENSFLSVPVLEVVEVEPFPQVAQAEKFAEGKLTAVGVAPQAVKAAFQHLEELQTSMRGALLVSAHTGRVLPLSDATRGVRVTNMDAGQPLAYKNWLAEHELKGMHAYEAIILATKVLSCPYVIGEICKSDDPSYTTGYVSAGRYYYRLKNFKELGNDIGGRAFFVDDRAPEFSLEKVVTYLEEQIVLVDTE